jgi:hypothetical protein
MPGNVPRAVRTRDGRLARLARPLAREAPRGDINAAARILQAARQLGGRVRISMKGAARVWIMTRSSA